MAERIAVDRNSLLWPLEVVPWGIVLWRSGCCCCSGESGGCSGSGCGC